MKERMKHIILVILVLLMVAGGISLFLYNASYNPNFSMIDVLTGATKNKKDDNNTEDTWNYTLEDLALAKGSYKEETIVTDKSTYQIIKNKSNIDDQKIILLVNQEDKEYQDAVTDLATYLEKEGYQVSIKECSEVMMLSLVHAGRYDVFLLSEAN